MYYLPINLCIYLSKIFWRGTEWLSGSSLFKGVPTTYIPSSHHMNLLPDHSWLDSDSSSAYIQADQEPIKWFNFKDLLNGQW